MANLPISQLQPGTSVKSSDLFPDVQVVGVGPVKVTGAQIKTFTSDSPTLVNPNIGTASGESLSLGGASIGSNNLAVTGYSHFNNAVTFGTQQSIPGEIILSNIAAASYETTIKSSNSSTTAWSFILPPNAGTNGYVLTTDGSGISSWTDPTILGIDINVNSTAVVGGNNNHIFYNNSGTFGEISNITTNGSNSLIIGTQQINQGSLVLSNTAAGAYETTIKSSDLSTASWTFTLPTTGGTSGYVLTTDGLGFSSWTDPTTIGIDINVNSTAVVGGTTGRIFYNNSGAFGEVSAITTNGAGTLTVGVQQTTQGKIILDNTAAGAYATTLQSSNSSTEAWNFTLPSNKGTSGYVLTTDGSGVSSWTDPTTIGIDINVNSTAVVGGTTGRIFYNNSGIFEEISAITTNGSDTLTVGVQQTTQGKIVLGNTAAGSYATTIQSSNSATESWNFTLPGNKGTNNYVLVTNGSGVSSWNQVDLTSSVANVLPVSNGGTGQSTNTIHGVLIGNDSSAINSTSAGLAGQLLQSGGALADPLWSTATYPSTTSAGTILASSSSNVIAGTSTPALGVAGSVLGTISFSNTTSGSITLSPAAGALGSSTITMPATTGTMTVLGNSTTGSGDIVRSTSPSLTTPSLGVAGATSLALGGATIGSNALAVTGTSEFSSSCRFGSSVAPVNTVDITGSFGRGAPVTKNTDFSVGNTENWIINNKAASSCIVTMPDPVNWTGREITIMNYQNQTVESSLANVVPSGGGVADVAILSGAPGKWATLVSDGTNWIIMANN